jgi:hypothetical protein
MDTSLLRVDKREKRRSPLGRIRFKYLGRLTESEAACLQEKAGWHPMGYGLFNFSPGEETTWECSTSCD